MIPTPVVVGASVVGGLVLLDLSRSNTADKKAGSALGAAMNSLRNKGSVAGVAFDVPLDNNAEEAAASMHGALVGEYGDTDGDGNPTGISNADLTEILTAWLAAFDAGRDVNARIFTLANGQQLIGGAVSPTCASTDDSNRSALGVAVCACAAKRDQLLSSGLTSGGDLPSELGFTGLPSDVSGLQPQSDENTRQGLSLVTALAMQMDAVDFQALGNRPSDADWSPNLVGGALDWLAGGLVGGIVSSNLFWAVGLGLIAYTVLT